MEQSSQSELGSQPSLRIPEELTLPLTTTSSERRADSGSAVDKLPAASPEGAVADHHAGFSKETHVYVREYIRIADQKAAFFFAVLTAILAFLNAQHVPARWLKNPLQWSFVDALGFVSMVGLAGGAAILLAVAFPRLKGSLRGHVFFRAIAEYESSSEYANDVLARSSDELTRANLQHCYDLSKVCCSKYRTLCIGFWIGSIGVGTALLFFLLALSIPARVR